MDEGVIDTQPIKRFNRQSPKSHSDKGENIMKKRILSMFIAVLMVVLMIPFSALTAFAAGDSVEIDTIYFDIRPDIGSKRLTAAQIGYYDEGNETLAEYHKRIEIKGNVTWTKDTQFGAEMGANGVYETSKDYFMSFKLGIKDEYKATTTFSSDITDRIFGQHGTSGIQAMAISATEIQVVAKVNATVPKILLNLPTPLANGEMTFADMAITNADTNGYYTVSQVDWHACNQFQLSTVTNKKSPTDKITHGIYSTRIQVSSNIAAVLETTPIEIQGFKNYSITRIDQGASYTSIDITVDTRTPLEKLGVTVTEPKAGEISTAPIALEGTKITSYEWYFMNGDTFGPAMTASTKFLSGNKYRLRVTVEASEGYAKLATCIPVVNDQNAEIVIDFGNGYNCYYDFTIDGEVESLSAELTLAEPKNGEEIPVPTVVSDNLQLGAASWHRLNSDTDEATTGNTVAIGSNFSYGKYRFVFILNTKQGYAIYTEPNIKIAGKNAIIEAYDEEFVRAYVDFEVAISVSVTEPVANEIPTAPSITGNNISVESYSWYNSNDGTMGSKLSNTDKFVANKAYYLVIEVKSTEGIFINRKSVPAYINGKEATCISYAVDGKTAEYRIEFVEHTHTPTADDGDCTTPITCVCGEVMTAGAASHTAGADDGDCTTAVKCTVCDKNAIEAQATHTAGTDDGDCTTAVKCTVCDKNAIEAQATHTAGTDDGDCTTAVKCTVCDKNAIEAKAAHTDTNVDGKCDVCAYDMPITPSTDPEPGTDPTPGTDPEPGTDEPTDDKGGLGAGAIIGIVVGVLAVLGGGGFALYWFVLRKKPTDPTDPTDSTTPVEEAPESNVDEEAAVDADADETEEASVDTADETPETEGKKDDDTQE